MPLKDDDIKQLIAILQRGLTTDEQSEELAVEEQQPIKAKTTKKLKNYTNNKNTKPTRVNKFDQMMEKDMHKSDSKIDQLLSVHPPTTRSREFDPIKVQCRVCQKIEEINPNLVFDSPGRYKCNKCSGAPG